MNLPTRVFLFWFCILGCAGMVMAQRPTPKSGPEDDPTLAPPPAVTTFQGRPIYRLKDTDVKPPELVTAPDPPPLHDFQPGKVVLWCVVGADGKAHLIKVARRMNTEADMKAEQNLSQWQFKPGKLKDQDIDVLMTVEVVWH